MAARATGKGPVRLGKRRVAGDRTWQVRAYEANASYPRGYVQYKSAETGKWLVARPRKGETLDECFDRVERAMDESVSLARVDDDGTKRTMNELIKRYVAYLRSKGRDSAYVYNRAMMADLWVSRFELSDGTLFGDLPVADWLPVHSQEVITHARTKVGAARVEDIGVMLSGMRKEAWRKHGRSHVRWLSPSENPLEDVSYGKSGAHHEVANAHRSYIEPIHRPKAEMVEAAIAIAPSVAKGTYGGGEDWIDILIDIAAYCEPRQAEQLALRSEDIDLATRTIYINGRWKYPRDGRKYYRQRFTKTEEIRAIPYRASLHERLATRVAQARVEAAERREAALGAGVTGKELELVSTAWLFPHKVHGVPPTKEQFNDLWLKIRQALEDDGVEWPRKIKFMNLRHHFATWAYELMGDWETVALLMGDDVQTVKDHYVLPSADTIDKVRAAMLNV